MKGTDAGAVEAKDIGQSDGRAPPQGARLVLCFLGGNSRVEKDFDSEAAPSSVGRPGSTRCAARTPGHKTKATRPWRPERSQDVKNVQRGGAYWEHRAKGRCTLQQDKLLPKWRWLMTKTRARLVVLPRLVMLWGKDSLFANFSDSPPASGRKGQLGEMPRYCCTTPQSKVVGPRSLGVWGVPTAGPKQIAMSVALQH
jgi:hypothetical protein